MSPEKITEVIFGHGHKNVQAIHHSTVEFTRDTELSRNGDCVLVVAADKGLADLSNRFRETLKKPQSKLIIKIEVDGILEEIHAKGSPKLRLNHSREIVLRKSDFVSDRTLGIHSDKAAIDLSRALVEKLKNPQQRAKITLTVQA